MSSPRRPLVLGLAASHNGAACLLDGDGEVLAAVQEERLTRVKRAFLRPADGARAIDEVLDAAGVTAQDLDLVVTCPLRSRHAPELDLSRHPTLSGVPAALCTHHRGHAVGAFAGSGWEEAAVLVVDGMGSEAADLDDAERAAIVGPLTGREVSSIYHATADGLLPREKLLGVLPDAAPPGRPLSPMPPFASLGTMYQAVAQLVFGSWQHAGKVMGLAPYGRARYPVADFLAVDGPRLVFSERIRRRRWPTTRWPAEPRVWRDLARSVQEALEVGMLHLAARAREVTGSRRLCLAGGVALNGIANERILRSGLFDEVFVLPAAEDSGTAFGAAWDGLWRLHGGLRPGRPLRSDAAGRAYTDADVRDALAAGHAGPNAIATRPGHLHDAVAALLARGAVVGWFQGRSELGPRALGQRSILLDPRRADGKDHLNARVKHREVFRPFAPAVLAREADAWFDLGPAPESPFMLRVVPTRPERHATIPAVVHVDGSARVQTVAADGGPLHRLLEVFFARTGVPVLLNTSFNVAGEPIVETPADALRCFASTGIDAVALGDWLVVARDFG